MLQLIDNETILNKTKIEKIINSIVICLQIAEACAIAELSMDKFAGGYYSG